jgi:hypothetical protein
LVVFCGAVLGGQRALTIDDVTKMVQAGVAKDLILKTIAESPVPFQLNPDQLIALKRTGVPDDIVRAMMPGGHSDAKKAFHITRFSSQEQAAGRSADAAGVPAGSKVYIATADGFDTYLTAALRKNKVPLMVVSEKDKAEYELTGAPKEQSAVRLVNVKTHEVVFAYTITKKDAKHGPESVAEACAERMKEAFGGE